MNFEEIAHTFNDFTDISSIYFDGQRFTPTESSEELKAYLSKSFKDYGDKNRVHDWKNYVSGQAEKKWDKLSLEQKLIIFIVANNQAGSEEWD